MCEEEVENLLQEGRWGVLCTLHEGRPYAVPVSFGYDGTDLYIASGPGRKLRALEASPGVCLTIADVTDGNRWRSVVVIADAERVRTVRERLHALGTIGRLVARSRPFSRHDVLRAASATVFRLRPVEISGRVRG